MQLRLFTLIYNASWANIFTVCTKRPSEPMFSLKATAQTFSSVHNATPKKSPDRKNYLNNKYNYIS